MQPPRRRWAGIFTGHDDGRAQERSGRHRTADLLRPVAEHGWMVRHDVALPGWAATVDHLVSGPTGTVVIASMVWSGPIDPDDERWEGPGSLSRSLDGLHRQADGVRVVLGRAGPIDMCLCVHDAHLPHASFVRESVLVVRPDQLLGALLRLRLRACAHPPVPAAATA